MDKLIFWRLAKYLVSKIIPSEKLIRAKSYLSLDGGASLLADRERFFYYAFQALSFNHIDGDYAEFGSFGGLTFSLAYHQSRQIGRLINLWAFDSFLGLPASKEKKDFHIRWQPGATSMSVEDFCAVCKSKGIPNNAYKIVAGFYDKTLENASESDEPTNICLAYIDCDLYSSTKSVLRFLMPRLKHGMIIAFDDYYAWSSTEISGNRKAALEYFERNDKWHLLPFIQFGWHGMSYVVEDNQLL